MQILNACTCDHQPPCMPPKIHEAPANQQRVQTEGKVERYFPGVRPKFAKAHEDTGDVRIGERRSAPAAPSGKAQPAPVVELDYRRVKAKAEIVEDEARRPTERFKAQIVKEESDDEDAEAAQRRRDAMRRQAGWCRFSSPVALFCFFHCFFSSWCRGGGGGGAGVQRGRGGRGGQWRVDGRERR